MEVVSHSPLPVSSVLWQSRPSAWVLTFVAKATFQLQPGKCTLAPTQLPLHEEDTHWDDDPARSLYAASDLEPIKPRVDIVIVGSAFAPQGQPVRSLFARLVLGDIDKSIEVHQDRTFTSEGSLIEGQRFSRMPISWERAAGGPETTNPIGVRLDARDPYGRLKLPNLQPPGLNVSSPQVAIAPVGFGPVPPTWPWRWSKLGRHAASWSPQWLMAAPVPEDIDWSFFNAAPIDQQVPELPDDARLVLENLHPQIPRLVTSFPALRPRATLEGRGGGHPLKMRGDSLWIDTDRSLATITFRGQIALDALEEPGRVVVTLEEGSAPSVAPSAPSAPRSTEAPPSAPKSAPHSAPPSAAKAAPARAATMTMIPLDDEGLDTVVPKGPPKAPQKASALPFLQSSSVQPIAEERTHSGGGLPFAAAPSAPREERPRPQPAAGLPFVKTGSWPAPTAAPAQPAPQAPPSTPAPPPVSPSRASAPGWIAPPSPAVPPVPTTPPVVPVAPVVTPAVVAPPPPVNPAAVQPPPPVRAPSGSTPGQAGPEGSVWAGGARAPEVPSGQTMGQLAAAAAATAAQAAPQDGSSGVFGASNAAAGPSPAAKDKPSGGGLTSFTTAGAGVRASSKMDQREVLHLIWYHVDSVARICKVPVWRAIISEMEEHPADDDLDDPAPTKDPIEIEDTRDIFEILVRAASQDIDQLGEELQASVRPGGKFVPSLLLLAGELAFPFDERETLKATVAAAAAMAGNDEPLKAAIKEARDFLASPDQLCPGTVIEGYTTRIREAYQRARRSIPLDQFEGQIERVLLEGRYYQKRQVLGMNAIRALLYTGTGSSSVRPAPVYLPEDIARKLPLFQKFRTRLIVELYMQEDQYEQHPAALKALALGRIQVPEERRR